MNVTSPKELASENIYEDVLIDIFFKIERLLILQSRNQAVYSVRLYDTYITWNQARIIKEKYINAGWSDIKYVVEGRDVIIYFYPF